jgi:hypothetical protein
VARRDDRHVERRTHEEFVVRRVIHAHELT